MLQPRPILGSLDRRPLLCGNRIGAAAHTTASAVSNAETEAPDSVKELLFSFVVFDMDGTLTVSNIDFKLMRERTGILEGDLFTVMDSWRDEDRVTEAHRIILEMEATACESLELQPGLTPLLATLRERNAQVALVTRNTTLSVNSFFQCLGEEWRDLFSIILTREFRYVKPDKRPREALVGLEEADMSRRTCPGLCPAQPSTRTSPSVLPWAGSEVPRRFLGGGEGHMQRLRSYDPRPSQQDVRVFL